MKRYMAFCFFVFIFHILFFDSLLSFGRVIYSILDILFVFRDVFPPVQQTTDRTSALLNNGAIPIQYNTLVDR